MSSVKLRVKSKCQVFLCIWTVISECGFFKLVLEVQFLCFWTLIFSNFLRFFLIIFRFCKIFSFLQNYFSFFFEKILFRKSCFCGKIRDFNNLDYINTDTCSISTCTSKSSSYLKEFGKIYKFKIENYLELRFQGLQS